MTIRAATGAAQPSIPTGTSIATGTSDVGRAGSPEAQPGWGREPWPAAMHAVRPAAGAGGLPAHHVPAGRLLTAAASDLAAHDRQCGPLPWRGGPGRLLPEIHDSGLTGRGGAAFPTWRKLAASAEGTCLDGSHSGSAHRGSTHRGSQHRNAGHRADRYRSSAHPVVVANAAEGEPESAKDVTLLTVAPHLVLDGLQLAAEAVGADDAFVYLKPGPAVTAVRRALAQRRAAGWDRFTVQIREAPETFVAGEASAVIAALEGGAARPRAHWQPLAEAGFHGRPTLVQNAETLAHLALIARWGASWFRSVGTAEEPGTFLATVTGAVAAPGVVEVPFGTPLGTLAQLAGGFTEQVGAFRVGGYSGAWLPGGPGATIAMSRAALAPWGAAPGTGVVAVLPARGCGLVETARIVGYLAAQNAGQCGPCVSGLPQLADAVAGMARTDGGSGGPVQGAGDPGQSAIRALRLAALVAGRG
ncbi:SLBB domain-containing protein, partial [Frankia sp. KB5]